MIDSMKKYKEKAPVLEMLICKHPVIKMDQ